MEVCKANLYNLKLKNVRLFRVQVLLVHWLTGIKLFQNSSGCDGESLYVTFGHSLVTQTQNVKCILIGILKSNVGCVFFRRGIKIGRLIEGEVERLVFISSVASASEAELFRFILPSLTPICLDGNEGSLLEDWTDERVHLGHVAKYPKEP